MGVNYEEIIRNLACTDCGGKEMEVRFLYESGGALKKQGKVLGMTSFQGTGNLMLVMCRGCGLVLKMYGIAK